MTFVLVTWLWTTGASALALLVLMGLQRVLIGPASGPHRQRPAAVDGLTCTVSSDVRGPQAA